MFEPHWAPFTVKKLSSSGPGTVGPELGVVIVEEGLLEDGTEDPAPLVLLRRLGGAEGDRFRGQIAFPNDWPLSDGKVCLWGEMGGFGMVWELTPQHPQKKKHARVGVSQL